MEDEWVPTVCCMCYNPCGVQAHKAGGLVVELKGDPNSPHSQGKMCAKGKAGLMALYDPYRLKTPLMRTNPEKGIGIDPKWKELSWEEALDIAVERLRKVLKDDRRKLVMGGLDMSCTPFNVVFSSAFGTPNEWICHYFCGNVLHSVHYLFEGAFTAEVDLERCNYCLLVGNQEGFLIHVNGTILAQKMATARARGMKLVVIDPVGTAAAAKADEWIPIRPGTDGALAQALLNVLLNELGIYDSDYIRRYTNGPYLVGADGLYLRDKETGKPLVWNVAEGRARPFDSVDASEPLAVEGRFEVDGVSCQPGFQLLKEHVAKFKPEAAAEITTVPAPTIRRIAQEFGEAARIGSTIVIDGQELPYRPAAVAWTKGLAHKHGMMTGLALELLNVAVGSIDMPGGLMGSRTINPPYGGPKEDPDGLIVPARIHRHHGEKIMHPETLHLEELFPFSYTITPSFEEGVLNPEKYGLPYTPEIMLQVHSNPMMSTANHKRLAEVLKKIPFIVSFALFRDETAEFADIILPDAHYLEKYIPFPNRTQSITLGQSPWYWPVGQPVVAPSGARPWIEVMLEIADRLGLSRDVNTVFNTTLELKGSYKLDGDRKYSLEEMADIWAKAWFGPEHDLAWFKKQGTLVAPKKIEDAYPRSFIRPRIPIYLEHFVRAGREIEKVTQSLGLSWDTSDYRALPEWRPCPAFEERETERDLYAVNFKLPFHTLSFTTENPWLNELGEYHPYAYKVLLNSAVAESNGISDGDKICVESEAGKVIGQVKVTECIHPEVVGIAGTFGHWAEGMPVAKGKGVHFNTLLPSTLDRVDMVSVVLDACVKVKVYKP